ncbi:MAG: type II toxin-antitoxin system VapC family toxin [Polyangiaceae bacterium]
MILIDTTPLVALCDPHDGLHSKALADLDRVAKRGVILCEPVLTEACFLLSHPTQRARLERVIVEIRMMPLAVEDEMELRLEVFRWLARYAEHEPDWADGYLAVVSERQREARVWTYDREFRTTWRRPRGTRISLAVR